MSISPQVLEALLPIETDRLIMRKILSQDAPGLFASYTSDPAVAASTTWTAHRSIDETEVFVKKLCDSWLAATEFNLVLTLKKGAPTPLIPASDHVSTENCIGLLKITQTETHFSLGYALGQKYWNNGYMTEAVSKVCEVLQSISPVPIQATTDPSNTASQKVLHKAGFTYQSTIKHHLVRPQLSAEPRDSLVFRFTDTLE